MTEIAAAPLQIRVYFCRDGFHVWISAGAHHPRLPCRCGRNEWQNREPADLERKGPPIYVNGQRVAEAEAKPAAETA